MINKIKDVLYDEEEEQMTEKQIRTFLDRVAVLHLQEMSIQTESDRLFCGLNNRFEIFLNDDYFEHVTEILQVTVTYDPTVYDDGTIVGYFKYSAYGKTWKVFSLL